ncbi:hypothetical protein [Streptomyces sp. NPDC005859]|uniref:hypothetical protein n=1 Tax=Streptomyces sp. NPDC005859 TaxID=3157170 RepID=UPI0033E8628B
MPLGGLRTLLLALGAPAQPWPPAGQACAVLLDALRAASARTPVLVCVDDAHLWDAPTGSNWCAWSRRRGRRADQTGQEG